MKTYIVTVPEVWHQQVRVLAESPEDALDRVRSGEGTYLDGPGGLGYIRSMEEEPWEVEED